MRRFVCSETADARSSARRVTATFHSAERLLDKLLPLQFCSLPSAYESLSKLKYPSDGTRESLVPRKKHGRESACSSGSSKPFIQTFKGSSGNVIRLSDNVWLLSNIEYEIYLSRCLNLKQCLSLY